MKIYNLKALVTLTFVGFLFYTNACHALPLNVTPKAGISLPTFVALGGTTTAYYTIANNTVAARANNFVKYLPLNVTQVTTNGTYADTCGATFNLAPNGSAGSSCTLQLTITGPVIASDPDPHHHLFVCLRGGTACAGTQAELNINASATVAIAGGDYSDGLSTSVLLAKSSNGGATWSYNSIKPADYLDTGTLRSTSCVGNTCIAAGSYSSAAGVQPLVALSTNGAQSWSYPDTIFSQRPADYNYAGIFNVTDCSGSNCFVAGSYADAAEIQKPLLAHSTDNGASWKYPATILTNLPSDFSTAGSFLGVSCKGQFCIGVGRYQSTATETPLLAQSLDGGAVWSYVSVTGLPTDYGNHGNLNSASCSSSRCIAVGQYENRPTGIQKPLFITSAEGSIWSVVSSLPDDFVESGNFTSVSCSGNICIAVGSYANGAMTRPMLAQSLNGGASWSYISQLPSDLVFGHFYGANCSGNLCVAVGTYTGSNGKTYPLLEQTTDMGATWTFPSALISQLPAGFVDLGAFNSVRCSQNICIAGGDYSDGATFNPLLATSSDNGLTWSYPTSIHSSLPGDYTGAGKFYSTGLSAG